MSVCPVKGIGDGAGLLSSEELETNTEPEVRNKTQKEY